MQVAASYFRELPRLAKAVQAATEADGINVMVNNKPASGQVVPHVHVHVVPRKKDDGVLTLPGGSSMIEKDAAEGMLAAVQAKLDG